MTIEEIQTAVKAGLTVHWMNERYIVETDKLDQWFVTWDKGGSQQNHTGLIHSETDELIGNPDAYYVAGTR